MKTECTVTNILTKKQMMVEHKMEGVGHPSWTDGQTMTRYTRRASGF